MGRARRNDAHATADWLLACAAKNGPAGEARTRCSRAGPLRARTPGACSVGAEAREREKAAEQGGPVAGAARGTSRAPGQERMR